MSLVYFFANQLEMLEITNLENAPAAPASAVKSRGLARAAGPHDACRQLQVARQSVERDSVQLPGGPASLRSGRPREKIQVVAWSDPSDVITYRVPRIGDVDVVNLYVQNATHWFGLFESPTKAHGDYAKNIDVLRVMFGNTAPSRAPRT